MEPAPPTSEQPVDAAPGMSLAGRLFNIYATPGDVLEEVVAAEPSVGNWLVPLLLTCLAGVSFILVAFSQPAILKQVRGQQEQVFQKEVAAGKMTQAQAGGARKYLDQLGPSMAKILSSIGAVVGCVAWLLLIALSIWLVGRCGLKANFPFLKALEVTGLANMIDCLGLTVTLLLVVARGNLAINPGPVLFVDEFDTTNKIHQLLASLNVMTLWQVAVLSLGLAKLGRVPFAKAALWLYGLWAGLRLVIMFSGLGRSMM